MVDSIGHGPGESIPHLQEVSAIPILSRIHSATIDDYFFKSIPIVLSSTPRPSYMYKGWGLGHGYFFFARLIDHKETWKYTNRSECCYTTLDV